MFGKWMIVSVAFLLAVGCGPVSSNNGGDNAGTGDTNGGGDGACEEVQDANCYNGLSDFEASVSIDELGDEDPETGEVDLYERELRFLAEHPDGLDIEVFCSWGPVEDPGECGSASATLAVDGSTAPLVVNLAFDEDQTDTKAGEELQAFNGTITLEVVSNGERSYDVTVTIDDLRANGAGDSSQVWIVESGEYNQDDVDVFDAINYDG